MVSKNSILLGPVDLGIKEHARIDGAAIHVDESFKISHGWAGP
jgi:hypothetical protein